MAAFAAAGLVLAAAAQAVSVGDSTYAAQLIERAHAQRLAASRDWQVLLHYHPTALGGWRSQADGMGFFLAGPRGQRDPDAELDATLRAFLAPGPAGDDHAQCRFPARWEWLRRTLDIDPARAPSRPCPTFEGWRLGMSANAATLVYATAYLNSPASMYGHTFFRLSRSTGEGNPLLDYVVNFAADVDTENGLLYALKGVVGLFPGRFYVMPYYVKVQEYSNIESRDLWEYELALTPDQVNRLVAHAWETRSTHFNYYFFTRNCSYHLLGLLEAADPDLHLTDHFDAAVIPSDTVRVVLEQPGLVRRVAPRPSLLTIMQRRKAVLSGGEVQQAETLAKVPVEALPPAPPADQPEQPEKLRAREALVIDAAYDYARFHEGLKADPSDAFKKRERKLLLARGRLGVPPQEVITRPAVDAPERGHGTLRLEVGAGGANQVGPFQTLSLRAALHDYLDPPRGYPRDARLEMGELRLRFEDEARAVRLDRADIIDIVSAAPIDTWVHSVSWKVWFGADNARELGCARTDSTQAGWRCLYAGVITGGGLATRFGPRQALLLLALAETDLGAGPAFSTGGDYRLGGGGELSFSGGVGDRWRFELGGRYAYYFVGERHQNLRLRAGESVLLSRTFALRATAESAGSYAQALAEVAAYF
jgi:hypothetical protein